MALTKKKSKSVSPIVEKFTEEQKAAYDRLAPRLFQQRGAMSSLLGYAGVGKTFMLGGIAQEAVRRGMEVRVTALTHQAKYILRKHLPTEVTRNARVDTIHSLLGLKLVPDGEGGRRLKNDKYQEPDIPDEGVVIVDEASMLGKNDEWGYVENAALKSGANWLFVGDPAQLPPVKDEPSPALEQNGVRLEEIVRQAKDNPIIETATAIRNGEDWHDAASNKRVDTVSGDGQPARNAYEGIFGCTEQENWLESAATAFEDTGFDKNPYAVRILAGTNDMVDGYNSAMKERLWPDTDPWAEGMWTRVRSTWAPRIGGNAKVKAHTSEMLKIEEVYKETRPISGVAGEPAVQLPVWRMQCSSAINGKLSVMSLAEEGQDDYEEEFERRLDLAKSKGGYKWEAFHDLSNRFAELDYPWASTIHKAQGMSVTDVYLDMSDIRVNYYGDSDIKQSLRYVGVTRAEERVSVLL